MARRRRRSVLSLLWLPEAVRAAPARPATACAMVDISRTNLDPAAASKVLEIYLDAVEPVESLEDYPKVVDGMTTALRRTMGGFWDVFSTSNAMSYSIPCESFVELSGEEWLALLCRQSLSGSSQQPCDTLGQPSNGSLTQRHYEATLHNRGFSAAPRNLSALTIGDYKNSLPTGEERLPALMATAVRDVIAAFGGDAIGPDLATRMRSAIEAALQEAHQGRNCHGLAVAPQRDCRWGVVVETECADQLADPSIYPTSLSQSLPPTDCARHLSQARRLAADVLRGDDAFPREARADDHSAQTQLLDVR